MDLNKENSSNVTGAIISLAIGAIATIPLMVFTKFQMSAVVISVLWYFFVIIGLIAIYFKKRKERYEQDE